jgi:hypothetical protein
MLIIVNIKAQLVLLLLLLPIVLVQVFLSLLKNKINSKKNTLSELIIFQCGHRQN